MSDGGTGCVSTWARSRMSTSAPHTGAIAEVMQFDVGDAVSVDSGIARHDHSSSGSNIKPWLSTALPSCVIGT
jgi:hypothetical protein